MANIYLELELFLDPAVTDAGALKADIEKKISNWHKMVNADPKNKIRVSQARKYLEQGLSDLEKQYETARKEKLQSLQNDIKKAGRVGGINDVKLKKLKSAYKAFFSEATIEKECAGVKSKVQPPKLPTFTPPKHPATLVCTKKILLKEMQGIADDLGIVESEKCHSLYDFLQVSPSVGREELYKKAQDKAEYARKMPKTDIKADSVNRLAGKCINFFKDDQNRKNYDVALRRYPFDTLCEVERFEWRIDEENENRVPWEEYQDSINKTVQLGINKEEAPRQDVQA